MSKKFEKKVKAIIEINALIRFRAKRFIQLYGQIYTDNFSSTISMTVICSLVAIAAQHVLRTRQTVAKTVF